jgi:hypothetical protein
MLKRITAMTLILALVLLSSCKVAANKGIAETPTPAVVQTSSLATDFAWQQVETVLQIDAATAQYPKLVDNQIFYFAMDADFSKTNLFSFDIATETITQIPDYEGYIVTSFAPLLDGTAWTLESTEQLASFVRKIDLSTGEELVRIGIKPSFGTVTELTTLPNGGVGAVTTSTPNVNNATTIKPINEANKTFDENLCTLPNDIRNYFVKGCK